MEERRQIFREQSLERLSSPDRLDQLLQVIRPHSWIGLATFGMGIALATVWSIFGRVPTRITGTAILVHPKQVVPFQSPSSGQIARIPVGVGDVIAKGDVLATLKLPALEKQLDLERIKLEQFEARAARMTDLEVELAERERDFIREQRELLGLRIEEIRAAADEFQRKSDEYIAEQRKSIDTWRTLTNELGAALQDRLEARESLARQGDLSEDQVLEIRAQVVDNKLQLAELEVRADELELRANSARELFDGKMDLIRDLSIDLHQLELRELLIDHRLSENELTSTSSRQDIERSIEELEKRLEDEGAVRSEHSGKVLEIVAALGQHVAIGQRLGKIEVELPSEPLMALAYFSIKDGKRIKDGAEIRVSPSTVERERHGGIIGEVVRVSDYPVTIEAAANQIGDVEIARTLLGGESRIEVITRLRTDPDAGPEHTGYAWTSGSGPKGLEITAGTTAQVRVTIEKKAPITLVLPFLKSTSGL